MNRAVTYLVVFYVAVASAQAQQIASVDVSRTGKPSEYLQKLTAVPDGCKELSGGTVADGFVLPPTEGPRNIEVSVTKLSSDNPVLGSEVEGDVQLRNSGEYPIQIPWSLDPNTIDKGQDFGHLEWNEGSINVTLMDGEPLEGLSLPLFGSSFSEGSELTIQPGEWVTLIIKFRVAPRFPIPGRSLPKGEEALLVEWEQADRTRVVRNCALTTGWYSYRSYYRQRNPTVTIDIQ
jgi:hypothetical protein